MNGLALKRDTEHVLRKVLSEPEDQLFVSLLINATGTTYGEDNELE